MGFVHDKDDAADLTQDVFIKVYKSLSGFKSDSAFSTWIYRIAVNICLNKVRKSPGKIIFQHIDTLFGSDKDKAFLIPASETDNPENIIIRSEHFEWLQKALDSLPENQRTAIILSKYDDLPQKEIAVIMNTSEGAVEALIQRGKKNLRNKLSRK
jgi:RNA polymerase sigma-70 factor (ECF subfamily)